MIKGNILKHHRKNSRDRISSSANLNEAVKFPVPHLCLSAVDTLICTQDGLECVPVGDNLAQGRHTLIYGVRPHCVTAQGLLLCTLMDYVGLQGLWKLRRVCVLASPCSRRFQTMRGACLVAAVRLWMRHAVQYQPPGSIRTLTRTSELLFGLFSLGLFSLIIMLLLLQSHVASFVCR